MQTKSMQGIVAIAVFGIAANRMPHIGRVDTNLVLAPRFQLKLHERVVRGARQRVVMGDGILTAIIYRRAVGHVGLVVLQPVLDGTLVVLHLARADSHITAVVDDIVPVVLQNLLRLHILRIDHQSAGVAIQPMHHVGRTLLAALLEVIIEHALHVQTRVARSHREDADSLLYYDEPLVLIHNLHVTALETLLVALGLTHSHLHAALQGEVKLAHGLAVHLDTSSLQRSLDLGLRLLHVGQQPFQQWHGLIHDVMVVIALTVVSTIVSHIWGTKVVQNEQNTK